MTKKTLQLSAFPPAKIRRVMQMDDEVGKLSKSTPLIVGRALELFSFVLTNAGLYELYSSDQKKLQPFHLKRAVNKLECFDFIRKAFDNVVDPFETSDGKERASAAGRSRQKSAAPSHQNTQSLDELIESHPEDKNWIVEHLSKKVQEFCQVARLSDATSTKRKAESSKGREAKSDIVEKKPKIEVDTVKDEIDTAETAVTKVKTEMDTVDVIPKVHEVQSPKVKIEHVSDHVQSPKVNEVQSPKVKIEHVSDQVQSPKVNQGLTLTPVITRQEECKTVQEPKPKVAGFIIPKAGESGKNASFIIPKSISVSNTGSIAENSGGYIIPKLDNTTPQTGAAKSLAPVETDKSDSVSEKNTTKQPSPFLDLVLNEK